MGTLSRSRLLLALPALLGLLGSANEAAGQDETIETFSTAVLGRPVAPLYTRSRAMGANGVALHGGNLTALNPASLARASSLGVWVAFMPERATVKGEGVSGEITSNVFPVGRVAISANQRFTIAVSFQSFLNQSGGIQFIDTLELVGGDTEFQETRFADGGITRFGLEGAAWLGNKVTVGAALQFYRGETRLAVERAFPDTSSLIPYRSVGAVDYTGFGVAVGAEYQPVPGVILGGTFAWASELDMKNDSSEAVGQLPMPLQAAIAGSFQLSPSLLVTLGGGWVGWSTMNDEFTNDVVDTYNVGGGLELRIVENPALFLRAGGRWDRMPFEINGDVASERAVAFGGGIRLGRARLDLSFEFGSRGDEEKNSISESFTRWSGGMAIFTN